MMEWWRRLAGLLRRSSLDADLEEEMQTHLSMKASDTGDPHAARRQFGNTTLLLEDARSAWGWPAAEAWLRDFRYASRVVVRRPGFTATVVLTLALGIGASSTIFSLVDAVLIRPLPYPNAGRLVAIHEAKPGDPFARTPVAPGRLEDWQRLTRTFEALAGSTEDRLTDTTGQSPERLSAALVSPRFLSVLETRPELGRGFTPAEERFGGPLVAVISDGLWRRRFSADPGVLGRGLLLANRTYVIVGVMPRAFQYPSTATELWIPKQASPGTLQIRENRSYRGIGRLKPGVSLGRARTDLAAAQKALGEQYPNTDAGWTVTLEPLKDELVGPVRQALWLLFASVCLLLVIACANVACLLLARLNGRAAEIATRCSLGAGRAAVARQLLAEGLLYALLGGLLGMAAAFLSIGLLRNRLPGIPRISELAVDTSMLLTVAGFSALAVVLFSLAPIVQVFRRDLTVALIQGGRSLAGGRQRLPRFLVSAQMALATALVIGAGLFLRSLVRLQETPLGFRPDHVLTLHVSANSEEPAGAAIQRHERILTVLASLPGVTAVSMSTGLPGVNPVWPREFEIGGEPAPGGTLRFAGWRIVTAGYFQTVGIPILAGRTCRMDTDLRKPFEALVNRSFADRYFPGRDPIGRTILGGPQGDSATKAVGVVGDAREDGYSAAPQPLIYACGYLRFWPDSDFLIQARNPAALAGAARDAIRALEPGRPVYSVHPLTDSLSGGLSQTRFRTLLVSLFSIMALTLAAIGLYGVMAYMVAQRRREIGIRVALGARPGQIVGDVMRSGFVLAGCGIAAGLVLAAVGSRLMGRLLYGIHTADAITYLSATGVLWAVALLACLIPCRRATSIDPNEALRSQ
jgi:putative ABC transport system permease protein